MSDNKIPVSVQKNCEITAIQPEAEEGHYAVKAKFSNGTETTPVADSVPKIKKLWAETNANRTITKENRIKQKISNLHTFVHHLAEKKGIPQERIDEALEALSELNNLTEVIGRYRIQYLPELDAELKELQECEECLKHFTIG